MVEPSVQICRMAARLRAKHGIRTPDAIHVATALATGATEFLTNDRGLSRVTEIRVLVLGTLLPDGGSDPAATRGGAP